MQVSPLLPLVVILSNVACQQISRQTLNEYPFSGSPRGRWPSSVHRSKTTSHIDEEYTWMTRPLPTLRPEWNVVKNGTYATSVRDFGAKGDGKEDDTASIQRALDASYQHGSSIVIVPPGQYVIKGNITIPKAVTLQGTFQSVHSHVSNDPPLQLPRAGSVLLLYGGRGESADVCTINVTALATLRGFTIYYPEQVTNATPVAYPWSMCLTGENAALTDVECLNCWNAVRVKRAPRHYIARVQGQPIQTGIFIDAVHDIGRMEDVHFNAGFSSQPAFYSHRLLYGRAFVFGRTDWEYVFNTFASGYAIGYHFINAPDGPPNGNFLGIGADMCANASIKVDLVKHWGVSITNGEFAAFDESPNDPAARTHVLIAASNTGSVRFDNCAFWGPSQDIARISGSGSTLFQGCTFKSWDSGKAGSSGLKIAGATGSLLVQGCEFDQGNTTDIHLGSTLSKAIITGNIFAGKMNIQGTALSTQIGFNADATPHSLET